jgi:CSLREA domain-containing protein
MLSRLQIRVVLCALALMPMALHGATITVTTTADTIAVDGGVSLREAITAINAGANSGDVTAVGTYGTADTINFNIPGGGVQTIVVTSQLPPLVVPVVINGYSQPGSSVNTLAIGDDAVLNIALDGVTRTFNGISFFAGSGGSTVRGLVLERFQVGVQLATSNVLVAGNFIGTDATGLVAAGNQIAGVNVTNGAVGNNQIGTAAPADRNLISGNVGGGIIINSLQSNPILGNYIGTTRTGIAALPNGATGVTIGTLGGTSMAGPIIGGSTAVAGTGAGNVISGNGGFGIEVVANAGSLVGAGTIQGNLIGLGADGTTIVANALSGIDIFDTNLSAGGASTISPITIGGSSVLDRNVISGNANNGVIVIATGTAIHNNFIGTDISGTVARPNVRPGVNLNGGGGFGGSTVVLDNVISGNTNHGVRIAVTTAVLINNKIGTDVSGVNALGNNGFGVLVDSASAQISNNTIANNANTGVQVEIGLSVVRNASDAFITANSITSNGQLGINLNNGDLVTPNDAGDPDIGPNLLQNYPVITSATIAAGNVSVSGTLNSTPSSTFTLEFFSNSACDASGFGEGKTYLGSAGVATDATGNASFGPLNFAVPAGETVITSTATSSTNLTSEFSACAAGTVVTPTATINNATAFEGNSGTTNFTFTVTLSSPAAGGETVTFATANGTATSPTDYTAIPAGVVTFLPGATSGTIIVAVNGDTAPEPDETFTVTLTGGTGVTIGTPSTGTGTIQNDDIAVLPAASISSVSANEGNAGITPFTFTVTLSQPATGTETVNYITSNGTATAPTDYTPVVAGVVNFAAGATTATITINVVGDTTFETDETFTVTLTGGTGISIGAPAIGTGTILNDDATVPSTNVPTTSEWMLLLIAASLAVVGLFAIRRV